MQLKIGNYVIDENPAQSTTAGVRLRLDPGPRPFAPETRGNELRIPNLLARIETASESACKTAHEALTAALDNVNGNDVQFYNDSGSTLLYEIASGEWLEMHAEYFVDIHGKNALVPFSIVANRDAPALSGQIGAAEWQLINTENGLTGATVVAQFGPSASKTAWANADDFVTALLAEPPVAIPPFYRNRLRNTFVSIDHSIPKGKDVTVEANHRPMTVIMTFREVYSGIADIPGSCTNVIVSTSMAHEEMRDIRGLGGADGSSILTLSGSFTLRTEGRDSGGNIVVPRERYLPLAKEVYETIEADFLHVHDSMSTEFVPMGDAVINLGMDSGNVIFSRAFRTTNTVQWSERTTIENIERVTVDEDYLGESYVHQGAGGPITTLQHSLTITKIGEPAQYQPPNLDGNWIRVSRGGDVDITSALVGGQLVYTTTGASTWRYANPSQREASNLGISGTGANPADMESIGDGKL